MNYGIVTLTFSTSRPSSVSNCESNFRFSVLSSIWKASSKTNGALLFRFVPEQIAANQLSLFDLGAEVPKRIVKSRVWLMTIRFGLSTTTEWRKSTRTLVECPSQHGMKQCTFRTVLALDAMANSTAKLYIMLSACGMY